jgi:hypothetical protein
MASGADRGKMLLSSAIRALGPGRGGDRCGDVLISMCDLTLQILQLVRRAPCVKVRQGGDDEP